MLMTVRRCRVPLPTQGTRPHNRTSSCRDQYPECVPNDHELRRQLRAMQGVPQGADGASQQACSKTAEIRTRGCQAAHGPQRSHERWRRQQCDEPRARDPGMAEQPPELHALRFGDGREDGNRGHAEDHHGQTCDGWTPVRPGARHACRKPRRGSHHRKYECQFGDLANSASSELRVQAERAYGDDSAYQQADAHGRAQTNCDHVAWRRTCLERQ